MREPLTRRTLISLLPGAAAGVGLGTMTGCSPTSSDGGGTHPAAKLPAYLPFEGAKPDLPATEQGIQAGYFRYPANPVATVPEPPGGGPVTAFCNIFLPPPPGPDRNRYWQGLNQRLGVELAVNMVPDAQLAQKFSTMIAGGDLPDFVEIKGRQPSLPQLLKAKFADLTPHLAGDAIKDYPNLANIPTRCWRTTLYDGGIYGIPIPRERAGLVMFLRKDLFDQAGWPTAPANGQEFLDLCRMITDPSKNRWALGTAGAAVTFVSSMLGAPNGWRQDGGKLINIAETEENRRAIEIAAGLWRDGLIHPEAFAKSPPTKQSFGAGRVLLTVDNYTAWTGYLANNAGTEGFALDLMVPPGFDGGQGSISYGASSFSMTALKQGDEGRIKELLRIANWLAAPFGTAEHLYRVYGEEGTHYRMVEGNPKPTDLGKLETTLPVRYIAEAESPLYEPGREADVRAQYAYQEATIPTGNADPTEGLYSETNSTKGATLARNLTDVRDEVLQGRKPLADWDAAVAAWRSAGGDKIRAEYEEQLQLAGSDQPSPR